MLSADSYLMASSLTEALAQWSGAPEGSRLVAGATDTLPWARQGRAGDVHVPAIVDVSRVPEISGYQVLGNGRIRLGANLVFQAFLTDPILKRHLPGMPYCAVWFADGQIREQATLAGNIVNASPAADGTPPLIAMNGEVELVRTLGDGIARRRVPLAEFVLGPGRTALEQGEIVAAIECDSLAGYGGAFEKVGQRRSLVLSVVCVACCVKASADGSRFEDVRLAAGGIGPVPVRLGEVEERLRGAPIAPASIAEAAEELLDRVASRTRQAYRRVVVKGFVARAIVDALADAGVTMAAERNNG